MRRVWGFLFLLLFSFTFLNGIFAGEAEAISVTIIPEVVSVNSPLLIKVNPETSEKPIRITWAVYNTGNIGIGSFPVVDGNGICYFSNDDGNATCGPSPFFQAGETELYIYVVTPSGVENKTVPLNVSSSALSTQSVNREDNTVYMYFYGKRDWIKYSIYKEDLGIYQSERALEYNVSEGRYKGKITLNPGVYYFAFLANNSGTYESALKRIEIPSGDFLMIQTDKDEYWTGEKIRITGTTNADSVSGAVYFPDGTKAKDFTVSVGGDNTFSYEFSASSDWPEGEYEIKTAHPLPKTVKFSITEFFEVTPESVSEKVNKSEDFETQIEVKNLRDNATNITVNVTGDIKSEYVSLSKTYLNPLETASITLSIEGVESDIEGAVLVKTPGGLELSIPVSISVTEAGAECAPCPEGGRALEIERDYTVWSQECLAGEEITGSILLKNNGDSELSDFDYEVTDLYTGDQSIESLDSFGYVDVPVQDFSIGPGESEYMDITITPTSAGRYQGLITLKSGSESAFVFVDLNCIENITEDMDSLSARLAEVNPPEDIWEDINNELSQAQNALTLGNYQAAKEYYERAEAKIEILETAGVSQPADFTWVIIVAVIAIVAAVFLWYFKFKKPQPPEYGEETEDLEGF